MRFVGNTYESSQLLAIFKWTSVNHWNLFSYFYCVYFGNDLFSLFFILGMITPLK